MSRTPRGPRPKTELEAERYRNNQLRERLDRSREAYGVVWEMYTDAMREVAGYRLADVMREKHAREERLLAACLASVEAPKTEEQP